MNNSLALGKSGKPYLAAALGLCGLCVLVAQALAGSGQQAEADFVPIRVVRPREPITEFPTKPISEARDDLNPSELVLGVTVGKESRAYPINMLTGPSREILNDTLGGEPIAATW